jgi:hypothetical protein
MEKTEPIMEILKRVVASGFVKNAYPLSAILISNISGGKSTLLKEISVNENILYVTDITPFGFSKIYQAKKELFTQGKITHIIIPDLIVPLSRASRIVSSFIGFMNALIEEGVYRIQTFYITIEDKIKIGLITSTTTQDFISKRSEWLSIGFINRMIPISYSYTEVDRIEILKKIANQQVEDIKEEKLSVIAKEIKTNPEIFNELIPYAQTIDKEFSVPIEKKNGSTYTKTIPKPEPFRRQKQLEILLMANALLNERDQVTQEDFEWFKSVARWINLDFNPL